MALMLARVGALCLAALVLAGCGTGGIADDSADAGRGEQLFTANCGSCHTLKAARTAGKVGPNLDDAFAAAREDGLGESTIREVVLGQIRFPAPASASPETPAMPANIVEGDDAEAVAAYVASVAANPEAQAATGGGGGSDPKSLLATNCGSCHALAAAGIDGTVGPSLDQTQKDRAAIERQIANGGGTMPPFKDVLSEQQIRAIADYILKNKKG